MSLFTRFGLGHLLCRMSLEKTGYGIEHISRVFDHVQGKYILGFKVSGSAFIPLYYKKRHLSITKSSGGIMHKSKAADLHRMPKNRPTFGHSVHTAWAINAHRLVC